MRQALWRLGIRDDYVLLAGGPQAQKFGMADMEPIEKLIAWAKKTYPINPRRVYMFGKGEGGKISAEFTMTHPNIVAAAITSQLGLLGDALRNEGGRSISRTARRSST